MLPIIQNTVTTQPIANARVCVCVRVCLCACVRVRLQSIQAMARGNDRRQLEEELNGSPPTDGHTDGGSPVRVHPCFLYVLLSRANNQ